MKAEIITQLIEILLTEYGNNKNSHEGKEVNAKEKSNVLDRFIGKHVLVRHHMMGVNFGIFDAYDELGFTLKNSRKLWRWRAKEGVALESVAWFGVKDGTVMTAANESIFIPMNDLCGIMEISNLDVINELKSYPVSKQD